MPFHFVDLFEGVRDDHTTLARNPNYWGVDTYKGAPLVGTWQQSGSTGTWPARR